MRKSILFSILLLAMAAPGRADNYTKNNKTYEAVKTTKESKEVETGFTWKDTKGNEYPIFMSKNGHCYIKKTSKKSGKEYRQYLSEEVSKDICKQLGVEYVAKEK